VLKKVWWVGRTASTVFGLALMLALVFGMATMALGATGTNFILGKGNSAGATTQLTSAVAGPVLKLVNNGTSTAATALNLSVPSGRAPMTVNASAGKATNLNADKVDGSDGQLWAQINADGTTDNWKGMTGNIAVGVGRYNISFDRDITECAYSATIADNGPLTPVPGFIVALPAVDNNKMLIVRTWNAVGEDANRPFHLVVFCGDHQSAN
jgi:hypothetical protein